MAEPRDPLLKRAGGEALAAFVIALVVFGPISGLVLDGFKVDPHLGRPLLIAGVVGLGRFLSILGMRTALARRLSARIEAATLSAVTVSRPKAGGQRWLLAPLFLAGAAVPLLADKYWLSVATLALIYVLLGLGLNIVVGLAGLLDLGFVAFYAVGAYFLALGSHYLGIGFWTSLVLAPVLAACLGMVLAFPVLRMHGDYLAIVTLGFGEIIRLVLINWTSFTGGPNGSAVPQPTLFGLEFGRTARQGGVPIHQWLGIAYNPNIRFWFTYLVLLAVVTVVIFIVTRLRAMPIGRTWEALREDEIACRSLGINHVGVKLSAFMLGASTGGIAGVFFALQQGFVNPTSFTFFESALILAIVVLGGLGSTIGVVLAALVLTLLPEVLRDFAEYRVLIFGMLMVVMMIWRPRGLVRPSRPFFTPDRPIETGDVAGTHLVTERA